MASFLKELESMNEEVKGDGMPPDSIEVRTSD